MQRRRGHGGGDDGGDVGGGEEPAQLTADEQLEEMMQDARPTGGSPAAVRSVRVVERSGQAQPEGGAQEAAPPAALVGAGRPEHLPGGQQHADGARGIDPGGAQQGDHATQGGAGGDLLGLEPLVVRAEGLPPAPQGDPVVLGPGGPGGHQGGVHPGPRGGAENQPAHPPAQVQSGGHQSSPGAALQLHGGQGQSSGQGHRRPSDPQGLQAVMRTAEGAGGQRNPFWSCDEAAGHGGGLQPGASGPQGTIQDAAHGALSSGRVKTSDGLTHKDLLELEALRVQGFKDVEAQIQREFLRRKGEASGSGSFQSVVGDVGQGVGYGQKTLADPSADQLVWQHAVIFMLLLQLHQLLDPRRW
eukprot:s73_g20.t1